jgi:RNA polymerase sigma-70 factor (ECF subfamily)
MNEFQPGLKPGAFLTTRWSCVLRAGSPDGEGSERALEELCGDYWRPLYHFARRSGFATHDAEDLTQGFIAGLLKSHSIARARPDRGRFRTFLLGSFGHYIANHRRGELAEKRGGGVMPVSLEADDAGRHYAKPVSFDADDAERHYMALTPDTRTPETQYEMAWAQALLDKVAVRQRGEYAGAGRSALFDALQPFLSGAGGRPGYAALGAELGMSETAVSVAMHRLRKRYGSLLREEIAATLASEDEVDDELRHLMRIVSGAV